MEVQATTAMLLATWQLVLAAAAQGLTWCDNNYGDGGEAAILQMRW